MRGLNRKIFDEFLEKSGCQEFYNNLKPETFENELKYKCYVHGGKTALELQMIEFDNDLERMLEWSRDNFPDLNPKS